MRRRELITLLGSAAATPMLRPLTARAQQPAMPVIGFLNSETPDLFADRVRAFRQGLNETGYVEARNVTIEYRWAEGHYDRLPALAAELVRRQVTVIAANGPAVLPAKKASATIPITFFTGADPVKLGLVASLNRPGGNLTGLTTLATELGLKRLELLHELVPTANIIALLLNPTSATAETLLKDVREAARSSGLQVTVLHASTEREIDLAFASLAQLRTVGLMIGADAFFNTRIERLGALSVRHGLPTVYQYREFTAAGGLMSYGTSITDSYRLFGVYTGRILKGDKPADLPVQQAAKVELIINLKTAKRLGLTVPISLLGRADEVVE